MPLKTIRLWRIRFAVVFIITVAILVSLALLSGWFIIPAVFLFALLITLEVWLLPLYLNSYDIELEGDCLYIKKGLIFKSETILFKTRHICLKTFVLPDAKSLRLSLAVLRTYGGYVFIPELEEERVKKLQIWLLGGENGEN